MVQIQKYHNRTNRSVSNKSGPLLNSLFVENFSKFNSVGPNNGFKNFMKWARRSPELMGFIGIIATDIISDTVTFEPVNKDSGRNKKLRAEKFWEENKGPEIVEETIYDLLINGIGYNWLGKIGNKQLKEFCSLALSRVNPGLEKKELEIKAHSMSNMIKSNKGNSVARKLRHVAASTMSPISDSYEVIGYIQEVGGKKVEFSADEIMVFKLMPFDGKIMPFPPMEAILSQVYLLWLITQNYVSFFENGGKPDNVFILPKELAGSKNHEYLIETLKKYKKIQHKHGNLVFTGDLTVEKLMEVESQMENKDLGLYMVGILAMFYGVPISRIPFLVGKAASGGDAGGLADSGYWRKISVWQSKLEATYNRDLWKPYFGVTIKYRRGYLQDEVRETQNDMQRTSVAEQRLRLGLWTLESAGKYLNIDEDIIIEAQKEKKKRDEEEMKSGMERQNLENDGNVNPNQDNRLKRKQKQDTQNKNQASAGGKKINP